jgi:peptide chain release factor subunit 1
MQTNELTSERLRRLADLRPDGACVLSLFLNLDPSVFATPPARATEVGSLIDEAERRLREANDGLSHDQKKALRRDIGIARDYFKSSAFSAEGAHGLAVFACSPIELFETIKLPRPIATRAVIDDSPLVEPLAELGMRGSWALLLVNRQTARMLRGSPDRLVELPPVEDDVHGQHDQGGWSQARYQRSVEKEVHDHLKRTAAVAFRRFRRSPFDRLLLGGPEELLPAMEERLHPYLRERIVGRIKVDVETSTVEEISRAALPVIEEIERGHERDAFDRLIEGASSGGHGTLGLDDTLAALNERRVGTLLIADDFTASGVVCRQCGWAGTGDVSRCPVDGGELERREDVIERAIELAIGQSAEVLVSRHYGEELDRHGGIGAVLRF